MNCKRHPERVAVAQCAKCGSYVCEECAEKTEDARERFGTLCIDCYKRLVEESLEHHENNLYRAEKELRLLKIMFISGAILFVLGIIISYILMYANAMGSIIIFCTLSAVLGFILMSARPVAHVWRNIREEQEENGIELSWFSLLFVIGRILGTIWVGAFLSIRLWIELSSERRESQEFVEIFTDELNSIKNFR